MCVFTLPSYPYVFKLIKDRIDKDGMDHATVRRKYQMVKLHDRVGMADTWEYSQVALPRARFAPALLDELRRLVPADRGNRRHRGHPPRLHRTPHDAAEPVPAAGARRAAGAGGARVRRRDRQLAAANIFPGDMLYKISASRAWAGSCSMTTTKSSA